MWKAYPRHSVNLSAGCYAALLGTVLRGEALQGTDVERFEAAFAKYIGVPRAIGVSSGRAALYLALKALGLKAGDEVLMPAYTFHIVPLVIHACGLKPVFVDVDPDTYNLNIALIEKFLTPNTKAILATHIYGQPCDMAPILQIARARKLIVLEDCAHACGAEYQGQKVGSFGDLGLFTFAMAKNMPCFGGGMITLKDETVYRRLLAQIKLPDANRRKGLWKEILSTTINFIMTLPPIFSFLTFPLMRAAKALKPQAFESEAGQETVSNAQAQSTFPTRLTNLQAAVGLRQLTRLDAINAAVSRNARLYNQELRGLPGVKVPAVSAGRTHTFLYYRLEVDALDRLKSAVFPHGVDTRPDDMSDCTTLAQFRDQAVNVPVAQKLPAHILEIPNNPRMTEDDARRVAQRIRQAAQSLA